MRFVSNKKCIFLILYFNDFFYVRNISLDTWIMTIKFVSIFFLSSFLAFLINCIIKFHALVYKIFLIWIMFFMLFSRFLKKFCNEKFRDFFSVCHTDSLFCICHFWATLFPLNYISNYMYLTFGNFSILNNENHFRNFF